MLAAIDPGAMGAIAWMDERGQLLAIEDMPGADVEVGGKRRRRVSAPMLAALFRDFVPKRAVIENVGPQPRDGASGAFAFGKSAGLIEGVLAGLSIPYTLVTPPTWKRGLGLPADKGASRLRAAQLFPGFAAMFARVRDDSRAEAALIALHDLEARARPPGGQRRQAA